MNNNAPNTLQPPPPTLAPGSAILSFDIEEHHRIEAAAHLVVPAPSKLHYRDRMVVATGWILDQLAAHDIRATFFILGQIARQRPALIRQIADAGHEIASHSLDHRRVLTLDPASFREDLRRSRDALEQASSTPVLGYRAPTFSITRANPWALDVLAEEGFLYDSSIFPVKHDRYGIPDAPRTPFRARGHSAEILELPPLTLRLGPLNLPVGGGGYFRLFPLAALQAGLIQMSKQSQPALSTLYFHPWEFDPDQPRLPLARLSRFRTYVGTRRSRPRLTHLMRRGGFIRAIDAANALKNSWENLPAFSLGSPSHA